MNQSSFGIAFRRLITSIPTSKTLFKLARMYVNAANGDDDTDFRTNGEQRVLREKLPQCKVAFDVGANIGEWTELARSINPNLVVHCFEPSAAALKQLAAHNFGPDVKLNDFGLSNESRNATLHTFGEAASTNSLHARQGVDWLQSTGTETVKLDTLDAYCEREKIDQIDYLKIDTEGHELNVLRGAQSMLRTRKIKYIQLEYGGAYVDARIYLRDVFEFLNGHGYRGAKLLPRGVRDVPTYDQGLETFRLSNWLFTTE